MRPLVLLPLLLAACTPDPTASEDPPANAPSVDAVETGDDAIAGDERLVITTRDGDVDLGLTDEVVFFRLSHKTVEAVHDEMAEEVEDAGDGLGGTIARAVTGAVGSALRQPIQFPVDDIEDVRYSDGRIDILFEGDREPPEIDVDDESVYRQFEADDARQFVAAFRAVKAER